MWSLRNIYFYLVCFVSIILIITGLIQTVNSITELVFPDNYYESMLYYDKFENTGMTKEEYTAQREKEVEVQKQNDINRRKKRIFNSLAMVLVAFPFYIYHWKKIQEDQALANTNS